MTGAAPRRVVTVTPNPAVDQTIWVPGFRAGEVNRVARQEISPGGKGVNVSAFLAGYGVPTLATGFLGTPNAGLFESFFAHQGIEHRFVPVEQTTRTGIKVVDEDAGSTTDINFPGFEVDGADLTRLEEVLGDVVEDGSWVVLAGSLPRGAPATAYARLARVVHERGGTVALDTSGPALADAVGAGIDLVKPNAAELEELTGRSLADRAALVAAAGELSRQGIATVVVSLGADGALFVRGGEAVFAVPPPTTVVSTVGAGDAMVAGTVAGSLRGLPLAEVAALATAFSCVAISVVGPHLDAAAVDRVAGQVEVRALDQVTT